MVSPVDVVNLALGEVGSQGTVSSINPSDGTTEGNVASLFYQPKIDMLHRAANWNFCRRQASLTLLRALTINGVFSIDPPPIPWLFEYLVPADCLKVRFIIPTPNTASGVDVPLTTNQTVAGAILLSTPVKFIVASDNDPDGNPVRVILSNQENAIAVYTGRIDDPDLWDPQFLSAATSTLGAFFVNPLARNAQLMSQQIQAAMTIVSNARVTDGNEGLTSVDHLPDWMQIRGSGPGLLDRNIWFSGWDQMAWPNGLVA